MTDRTKEVKPEATPMSTAAYYAGRGEYRGPYREYERRVAGLLDVSCSLIDVGCGRTFPLAEKWLATGARVCGVDPVADPAAVPAGVEVVSGGAERLPYPDEEFDVVASCAVLEHLERPEEVFREFRRVLRPGGHAVLLTPSKYDYVSLAARFIPNRFHGKIVEATEGRAEEDTFPTFYRANSSVQIHRLAAGAGFSVRVFEYLDQSPYALRFRPLLYRLGCMYHRVIRSVPFLGCLNGWVLCVLENPAEEEIGRRLPR